MRNPFLCLITVMVLHLVGCGERSPRDAGSDAPVPPVDMHSSRISLDWSGVYTGMLPTSCGQGQATEITLQLDYTFTLRQAPTVEGIDGAHPSSGEFKWMANGSSISVSVAEGEHILLRVGEGFLQPLDSNGNPLNGAQSNRYRLVKK